MTTAASDPQIVPRPSASMPALRAADQGVADALQSVLSNNTRRVYAAQWRIFENWCDSVGLPSLPAEPLTVARYLAVRAGDGAAVATLRLATSAIAKVHEWAGHDSPGRDRGVREALKGWGRRLARPQRQASALTADVHWLSSASPLRNPVPAAAGSKRPGRPPSAPVSTWPWWPCCPTGDCAAPRLRLSPGETLCAGTTAAAASR